MHKMSCTTSKYPHVSNQKSSYTLRCSNKMLLSMRIALQMYYFFLKLQ